MAERHVGPCTKLEARRKLAESRFRGSFQHQCCSLNWILYIVGCRFTFHFSKPYARTSSALQVPSLRPIFCPPAMPDSDSRVYLIAAFCLGAVAVLAWERARGSYWPLLNGRRQSHERSIDYGPSSRSDGIAWGLEGCVGNTPLVRIKSLSAETGCEILGKAEVCLHVFQVTEVRR